jgi:putative restriction endonuclease
MRFWWVNQNQTYRHEVPGGYLWSPKRKSNGHTNPYYEFMREVAPGDIVFSFADTRIKAIGIVASHAYEAPKPPEFGGVGTNWSVIGWRVDVAFRTLKHAIRPTEYMDRLRPRLPRRYAPLRPNGNGLQNLYLTLLPDELAAELVDLIGHEARILVQGKVMADSVPVPAAKGLLEWEEHELNRVRTDTTITETTRQAVVLARRGQGLFKDRVKGIEDRCRLTGVDRLEHLRASHCKPWRDASNDERLDGENGLLLTPDADHLFDRGFLSFENNGRVLVSPVAHVPSMVRMGLDPATLTNAGRFTEGQKAYLDFHRRFVFLEARLSRK